MKRVILSVAAFLLLGISAQAALPPPQLIEKPTPTSTNLIEAGMRKAAQNQNDAGYYNYSDDDASLYAFQLFGTQECVHGWYNFPAGAPTQTTLLYDYGHTAGSLGIMSATHAKGKTYAYVCMLYGTESSYYSDLHEPYGIGIIDHTTGEFDFYYDTYGFHTLEYNQVFYDMAYDPITDEIYACEFAYGSDGSFTNTMNIYTIDQETCEPTFIGQLDCVVTAMAANNGYVYGITYDGDESGTPTGVRLIKFDPTTPVENVFKSETVVEIENGTQVNYSIQTMEFDLTTQRLWWLAYKDTEGFVAEIDLTDGNLKNEQTTREGSSYLSLTIPYQEVAEAAPTHVGGLKVTAGDSGLKEATISWKNPNKTYRLNELTDLSGVKIYRNDALLTTIETSEPGAAMSYTDKNLENSIYTYKLVPYNTAGDGVTKEYTLYIGEDIPDMVKNITAVAENNEVTLTWEQPSIGKNGGWIDTNALKYNIYRNNKKVGSEITETTFTDKADVYGAYTYTIEALTTAGCSEKNSIVVPFGPPVVLPYENELENLNRAQEFKVIDANGDENTWEYSQGYEGYEYVTSLEKKADDYLILPPVDMKAGKKYQLRFYYYTSNYFDVKEDLQILIGEKSTAESMTTVVKEFSFDGGTSGAQWYETSVEYVAEKAGIQNFGFKCASEPYMGFVIVSHIKIREMSDIEACALDVTGPVETYVGTPAEYTVKVHNIGLNPIANAKVRLLELSGNVLAETPIENLAVGETRDVKVVWTPTEEKEYQIWGNIKAEEDTYTWDNSTDIHLNVNVNSENSDRWVVIGQYNEEVYDNRLICIDRQYSRSQWLFYPDEMGSDLNITGLRLQYSFSEEASLTEIPLIIRMGHTSNMGMLDSGYGYGYTFIDKTELDTVYEGTIDLEGIPGESYVLEVKLDNPFEYSKEYNLIVEFDKEWDTTFEWVRWHLDKNPKYADRVSEYVDSWGDPIKWGRGGFFNYFAPYESDPWNTVTDYYPYIKFSYKHDTGVGKIGNDTNLKIAVVDGALMFGNLCELVEVYTIAGVKIASERNISTLSTNYFVPGIYIVKAVENGAMTTQKVIIK